MGSLTRGLAYLQRSMLVIDVFLAVKVTHGSCSITALCWMLGLESSWLLWRDGIIVYVLLRLSLTPHTKTLQEPLSYVPNARPAELKAALNKFSLWLSGLDVVQSARLSELTVQRLHMTIHHAALERMAKAYKDICEEVRKGENKYEAASTLLGSERPFGQVHLLWQIFGLEERD